MKFYIQNNYLGSSEDTSERKSMRSLHEISRESKYPKTLREDKGLSYTFR